MKKKSNDKSARNTQRKTKTIPKREKGFFGSEMREIVVELGMLYFIVVFCQKGNSEILVLRNLKGFCFTC